MALLVRLVVLGLLIPFFVSHSPQSETAGAASSLEAPHAQGEVLIRFKAGVSPSDEKAVREGLGSNTLRRFNSDSELLKLGPDLDVETAIELYGAHPAVAYVEPNYIVEIDALPDDPHLIELYGLRNTGQTGGTPGADIDAEPAWGVTTGTHEVIVGVIDTGVDYTHPDLADNIWTNPGEIPGNGIDDDDNGYVDDVRGWDFVNDDNDPMDDHSHGTHVSGTIGAIGDNAIGVVGVNWKVKIVPLKFLAWDGYGTTADAIAAVEYATLIGVDLTNNSWGGGAFSQALLDAITAAHDAGVLFIASAGNTNRNNDLTPHYPGSYEAPNVITVAATDHNDNKAYFSSYGATSVDLAAPGVSIFSTVPGSAYSFKDGTSMSTPHVSGAAALILSAIPNLSSVDLKARILDNVDPVASMEGITVTGGRLNVYLPLAVQDETPPGTIDDLVAETPTSNTVFLHWSATGDDGDTGTASSYDVRYSTAPLDELSFAAAMQAVATPDPAPPGNVETMEVVGLEAGAVHYFAVKAEDEWGNAGPISNIASETTLPPPSFASSPGAFGFSLLIGETAAATLTLQNVGEGTLDWQIPWPSVGGGVQWLTVAPTAGRLFGGQSQEVAIQLETIGLAPGTYDGTVSVLTNDPLNPTVDHPVTLDLAGAPIILVDPATIDFGELLIGMSSVRSFEVSNIGTETMTVSGIVSGDPSLSVSPPFFVLPVNTTQVVDVTFTPVAPGPLDTTLTLLSDASNTASASVTVLGSSVLPPVIQTDPGSFDETLSTGQTVTRNLRITNAGASDLVLELGWEPPGPGEPGHDPGPGWEALPKGDDSADGQGESTPPANAGGPDAFGYVYRDSDAPDGPVFEWVDISATGTPVPIEGDDTASGPIPLGFDFPFYGESFSSVIVCSNGWLSFTHASVAYSNPDTLPDPGTEVPENLLAPFFDDLDLGTTPRIRYENRDGRFVVQYSGVDRHAGGSDLTFQVVLSPDGAVRFQYLTMTGVLDSATIGIQDGNRSAGLLVAYNQTYVHDDMAVEIVPTGFPGDESPDWVGWSPAAATVPAGAFVDIEIVFDAGDSGSTVLEGEIRIDSNDPLTPFLLVPVGLTVIGAPNIVVLGEVVTLESIQDFTSSGGTTTHVLAVEGSPDAGGTVEVIVNGDFGSSSEYAEVIAEGIYLGTVGNAPDDCAVASRTFWLSRAELAALTADGIVEVEVDNTSSVGTFCSVNDHTVRLRYNGELLPFDFGTVFTGESVSLLTAIHNLGAEVLEIGSIATTLPEFYGTVESSMVAPGGSTTLTVTFNPTASGVYDADLTIASNDPDTPSFLLPVTGIATAPPVIGVDPDALDSTLFIGAQETQTFTISNSGDGPLDFSLSSRITVPGAEAVPFAGLPSEPPDPSNDAPGPESENVEPEQAIETLQSFFEPLSPSPVPLTCVVADAARGHVYAQANQGYDFFRYVVATDTWETLAPAAVYSGNNCGAALLNGKIYTSYAQNRFILGVYDIATDSWSTINNQLSSGTANIATDGQDYLYRAAGYVLVRFDPVTMASTVVSSSPFAFTAWGGLRYLDGVLYGHRGNGSTTFGSYDIATGLWSTLPSIPQGAVLGAAIDPIAREYVAYGPNGGSNVYRYSIDSGSWGVSTLPFFSVYDGGLAWVSGPKHGVYLVQGENGTGFARMIIGSQFVGLDPISGTIPPWGSQEISVSIDAREIPAGVYANAIDVSSNDPVDPLLTVPVNLTVVGAPNLVVAGESVVVESSRDFEVAGALTVHSLPVSAPPGGGGTLAVVAMGDYGDSTENATVIAEGLDIGTVGPVGTDCTPATGAFEVGAADLEALIADGVVWVDVQNSPDVDPLCATNSHTVRLIYQGALDPVDFGTVLIGASPVRSIVLRNTGSDVLEVSSIVSDLPAFVPSVTALTIPPGSDETITISFAPLSSGSFDATLTLMSNDPDSPLTTVSMTGVGADPPVVGIAPAALDSVLPVEGQETRILTISNTGLGALEFTATVVPVSGESFVTLDPVGGAVPPGGALDVLALIDATGLLGGLYEASIEIASNDPVTPAVIVPVTLTVIGTPDILVAQPTVVLESVQSFESVTQTNHSLIVTIPPAGSPATLELIADGDFGDFDESATATAEGLTVGSVGFTGSDCTPASDTFPIDPDDLATLVADGVIEVLVENSGAVNPICPTNIHYVRVSYAGQLDVLDFGTRFVGTTGDIQIVIENPGTDTLTVTSIVSDTAEFSPSLTELSLVPGASQTITITFAPSSATTFEGVLGIHSNDPDTPVLTVPMTGTGEDPPVVGVDPSVLDSTLFTGQQETQTLTVSNSGHHPLDFSLSVIPGTTGFIALDPVDGTVPPLSALDVAVVFDATTVDPGIHQAEIVVSSNDPLTPELSVPVMLTAVGLPDIVIGGGPVTLESLADWSGTGASTSHVFAITAPPSGAGSVELIADGDYGGSSEIATLTAEGLNLGSVGAVGTDCLPASGSFPVGAADLTALAADGLVEIEVQNSGTVDGFCDTNRHTVRLSYSGPTGTPDFGSLFVGASVDRLIGITNAGNAVLEITSIESDLAEFSPLPTTMSLAPGAAGAVTITFTPSSVSTFSGLLSLHSNDPDTPVATVAVTGIGLDPPIVGVAPPALASTVFSEREETQILTVSNDGGNALEFDLSLEPSGATFVTLDTATGTVPPYGSMNVGVTFTAVSQPLGLHQAEIVVSTNDPITPVVNVPVSLTVVGASRLELTADLRETVESTREFDETEALTTHTLHLPGSPAEHGDLELTVDGDFGSPGENATVTAEGVLLATLPGVQECGTTTGSFVINAADLEILGADGMIEVEVQNSPIVDPFCERNSHALALTYRPSPDALDFGTVLTGLSRVLSLTVENTGTSELALIAIESDSPAFSPSASSLNISPGLATTLAITFTPSSAATFSGALTFDTNDPETPTVVVSLDGVGADAPVIDVAPSSVHASLQAGSTTTENLTLSNNGSSPLEFSVTSLPVFPSASGTPLAESNAPDPAEPPAPVISEVLPDSPQAMCCVAADSGAGVFYAQQRGGVHFYRYVAATRSWEALSTSLVSSGTGGEATLLNGKVYVSYIGNSRLGVYDIALDTWGLITNPLGTGGPITSDGEAYLYLASGSDFVRYDPVTQSSTTLASPPFPFETRAGLVYFRDLVFGHQGQFRTGFAVYDVAADAWAPLPSLPGIGRQGAAMDPFNGDYYTPAVSQFIYRYSLTTGTWSTWQLPFIIVESGLEWISEPSGIYFIQGSPGRHFGRIPTSVPTLDFIRVDPVSGTVPPMDSVNLDVLFDARTSFPGQYAADIEIESNDPQTPVVVVPASLTVVSGATLVLGGDEITVESTLDYSTPGAQTTHLLPIAVPPARGGTVELVAVGDFGQPDDTATANAEGLRLGAVGGMFTECPTIVGTFDIDANDLSRLTGDGIAAIEIQNSDTVDLCTTNNHTVRLRYRGPLEQFDFGELFVNSARDLTFAVTNIGSDPLIVSLDSDRSDFSPEVDSLAVAPRATTIVTVTFIPQSAGAIDGTLTLASNDPDRPVVTVAMTGVGIEPPIMRVDPVVLDHTMAAGGQATRILTISNDGASALEFSLSEMPETAFVDLDPVNGSIPALASVDITVQLDASNLLGGTYGTDISIVSNDPLAPTTTVPVVLTVVGIPDIAIAGEVVTLESTLDYAVSEALTVHSFPLATAAVGEASVELAVDGNFETVDEIATATAEGVPLGSVGGVGTDCTAASDTFPIDDVALGALVEDGTVVIEVRNSAAVDPVCATNSHTVRFGYRGFLEQLDFGAIIAGTTSVREVVVENRGTDLLQIESIASDDPAFSLSATALDLPPFSSAILTVTFNPVTAGSFVGTLTMTTNDPEMAILGIALVGTGGEPPIIDVQPATLSTVVFEDAQEVLTLTVANGGGSDLVFSIEATPSSFTTVNPVSGTVPGTASLGIQVTLDTTGLPLGPHEATVVITSNDPVTPTVSVPVSLTIVGAPNIGIATDIVEVASEQSFFASGASTNHSLPVEVSPVGGGVLQLIADGDFGNSSEIATITVEGQVLGSIGNGPGDCVPVTGEFPLDAGLLATLAADSRLDVNVRNSSAVGVFCDTNLHRVVLRYGTAPDSIDFGELFVGQARTRSVEIVNTGSEQLEVSSIISDAPEFVPSPTTLSLAPGSTGNVSITFTPSTAAMHEGNLTIASNDPDSPTLTVPMTGTGLEPPVVHVEPASIGVSLLEGEQTTETLTLSNLGGSPLEFTLDIGALPPDAVASAFAGLQVATDGAPGNPSDDPVGDEPHEPIPADDIEPSFVGRDAEFLALNPSPVPLTCVVADVSAGHIYAQANNGYEFFRYVAATGNWQSLATAPVPSGNNGGAALLNGKVYTTYTGDAFSLGVYDIATDSWSVIPHPLAGQTANIASDGQQYLYVVAGFELARLDPETSAVTHLAPAPFPFERWGGLRHLDGVLYGHRGNGYPAFASYDIATNTWTQLSSMPAGAVLGATIDPLNREYVAYGSYDQSNLYRFSTITGTWSVSTIPFFSVNDGGLAWLPSSTGGVHFVQGENGTGFARLAPPTSFASVEPASGTVPPSGSLDVDVHFDTGVLPPGLFEAAITVWSNDPANPAVGVPLSLTIVGVPDIAIVGDEVTYESVQDYDLSGALTVHSLPVTEFPVGAARITLTADGDYGATNETASVTSEGYFLGIVGGLGADCVPGSTSFSITGPVLADIAADGNIEVEVQNASGVNVACEINRHTVTLSYDAPHEPLDFGVVFAGTGLTLPLEIVNLGSDDLVITSIAADHPEVTTSTTAATLASRETLVIELTYAPTAPGSLAATLSIESNDPDEPTLVLDLLGTSLEPPVADASPPSVEAALPPRSPITKTKSILLKNTGGSDLIWVADLLEIFSAGPPAGDWVDLPKGDESANGAGEISVERFAGPDAFGYRVKDSDDPNGPSFDWFDIATIGTTVFLTGDDQNSGPVAIGFGFPFYGESFDTVNICSNGWLSFTSMRTTYSNPDSLPNTGYSVPENLIAPFWDDLHLRGAERIAYFNDGDRFIVQFTGADRFSSPADLTFQVILHTDGRIVFQYLSLVGIRDSATIGIQNGDRSIGLLASYNEAYVRDGFAMEFGVVPDWVTVTPELGVVPANGVVRIDLEFSSVDLDDGDFEGKLALYNNDPFNRVIEAPLELHVSEFDLDRFEIDPKPLYLDTVGGRVRAWLQLPPQHDPHDVVVPTVSLFGELYADPSRVSFTDDNGDGVDEILLEFDAQEFHAIAPPGPEVTVTIAGEVEDTAWFTGTDLIRGPQVSQPDGGETLVVGGPATLSWVPPAGPGQFTYDIMLTRDGGQTWEQLAENVSGTEYVWTVEGPPTTQALVRVLASNIDGTMGYDTSDAGFTIAGSIAPPNTVTTLLIGAEAGDVLLAWQPPATDAGHGAAEYYRVFRATSAVGPFEEIGQTAGETFLDSTHDGSAELYYRVVAANAGGASSDP